MKINQDGLALIKEFEGCSLTSYPDDDSPLGRECTKQNYRLAAYVHIAGWEGMNGTPWTIGYGATGDDVGPGMSWTQEQCNERLVVELGPHENAVAEATAEFNPTSNQFSALVSFSYNAGPGNMRKLLTDGLMSVSKKILLYSHGQSGVVLPGLARRRQAELDLFNKA